MFQKFSENTKSRLQIQSTSKGFMTLKDYYISLEFVCFFCSWDTCRVNQTQVSGFSRTVANCRLCTHWMENLGILLKDCFLDAAAVFCIHNGQINLVLPTYLKLDTGHLSLMYALTEQKHHGMHQQRVQNSVSLSQVHLTREEELMCVSISFK